MSAPLAHSMGCNIRAIADLLEINAREYTPADLRMISTELRNAHIRVELQIAARGEPQTAQVAS